MKQVANMEYLAVHVSVQFTENETYSRNANVKVFQKKLKEESKIETK